MARLRGGFAAHRQQHGIALVVVLWVLILLSTMAAGFSMAMRTEIQVARNAVERAQAQALADAGLNYTVMQLLKPRSRRVTDANAGVAEENWPVDGTWQELEFAGGRVQISVLDEAGKIDLNRADRLLLNGLLTVVGVESEQRGALLDAIEDWRDPDHLSSLNGAEDDDYEAAGLPFGAKDDVFASVTELRQVLGITPVLYQRLLPWVTVYSRQSGISQTVAAREVLMAVPGLDPGQVDTLLQSRGTDHEANVVMTPESRRYLSARPGLAYQVQLIARAPGQSVFKLTCSIQVTHRPGQPYDVLSRMEDVVLTEPPAPPESGFNVTATKD